MNDRTLQKILSEIVEGMNLLDRRIDAPRDPKAKKDLDKILQSLGEVIKDLEVHRIVTSHLTRRQKEG